jgi:DNA ligase (NAD+)
MDRLAVATQSEIEEVDGVGPIVAQSVHAWFREPANRALVERLEQHLIIEKTAPQQSTGPLAGKTVVVTGTLHSLSRDEAHARIRTAGGKVSNSVSKATHYVVVGENPGSKVAKAEEFGVRVLDEDAFMRLLSTK